MLRLFCCTGVHVALQGPALKTKTFEISPEGRPGGNGEARKAREGLRFFFLGRHRLRSRFTEIYGVARKERYPSQLWRKLCWNCAFCFSKARTRRAAEVSRRKMHSYRGASKFLPTGVAVIFQIASALVSTLLPVFSPCLGFSQAFSILLKPLHCFST